MDQKQIDASLRGIAGLFLIISSILYFIHSRHWIYFIIFIGLNLFQSSLTGWCPMIVILKKLFPEKKIT